MGSATIYLTRLVKFSSKAKLPKNPHAREMALSIISLQHLHIKIHRRRIRPVCRLTNAGLEYLHQHHPFPQAIVRYLEA